MSVVLIDLDSMRPRGAPISQDTTVRAIMQDTIDFLEHLGEMPMVQLQAAAISQAEAIRQVLTASNRSGIPSPRLT